MWTFICKKLAFENITFVDSLSGIRSPDSSKLAKNLKNDNNVAIFRHDVNVNFFWHCFVSNVNFGYWSKFHVNIITGSGIMTTFFYKGLIRNPEIRNTPVWVFPNIWRLGWGMDTQFGTNVCNKMLLNAAKFQGYSFYCFWVIKENPTGKGVKLSPTQIRVKPYQQWISPGTSQKILSGQQLLVIQYKNLQNNFLPEHLSAVESS